MVPLGLFPVLAATVQLILIQMNTGECLGIGPVPSEVRSNELPVDKQLFIHSRNRERRDLQCGTGYYLHPNQTHCCMLCHKGTYVAEHCVSQDRITRCSPCSPGSYMDKENSAEKCRGCQSCRSNMRQIALTECSNSQDTVCGCDSNYYRTSDSSEFYCMPCSACHNGTVLKECSTYSDTVCKCHKGFFLETQKKSCSPCSSCQGEECKEDCDPATFPSHRPPNSPDLIPILSCLVVVFAAGFLLLAMRRFIKPPMRKKLISAFSICHSEQHPSPPDLQLPQPEVQVTSIPQESNQEEMLLPSPPNSQGLPDCIQPTETQVPDCPAVLYAVIENVPFSQWREFMRRLGLSDNAIDRIQAEERSMKEAQYKMLTHWRQQLGQRATVERISSVLKEMELSGCSEAIQEELSRQA